MLLRKIPKNRYIQKMRDFLLKNSFETLKYVVNFSGHWVEKEIMKKEIYGTPTLVKFEDGYYYGVGQPDRYLKRMYGNYMKMPSEEERLPHFD